MALLPHEHGLLDSAATQPVWNVLANIVPSRNPTDPEPPNFLVPHFEASSHTSHTSGPGIDKAALKNCRHLPWPPLYKATPSSRERSRCFRPGHRRLRECCSPFRSNRQHHTYLEALTGIVSTVYLPQSPRLWCTMAAQVPANNMPLGACLALIRRRLGSNPGRNEHPLPPPFPPSRPSIIYSPLLPVLGTRRVSL